MKRADCYHDYAALTDEQRKLIESFEARAARGLRNMHKRGHELTPENLKLVMGATMFSAFNMGAQGMTEAVQLLVPAVKE